MDYWFVVSQVLCNHLLQVEIWRDDGVSTLGACPYIYVDNPACVDIGDSVNIPFFRAGNQGQTFYS